MFAVPEEIPVTTPVAVTVATPVAPELQIPPVAMSLSGIVEPVHTVDAPAIVPAFGAGLTVTTVFTLHPAPAVE